MTEEKKKRGRPAEAEKQLSQSAIINTAKHLMKVQGKVPSIRKLASTMDVDAMAIYHYFTNKNALLTAVAVSLVGEIYEPVEKNDWKSQLRLLCNSYLNLLKDHIGLLETMLTYTSESPALVFAQRLKIVLKPLNLNDKEFNDALDLLADYLHGFALAISCNPDDENLRLDSIDGPLNLYIRAISYHK